MAVARLPLRSTLGVKEPARVAVVCGLLYLYPIPRTDVIRNSDETLQMLGAAFVCTVRLPFYYKHVIDFEFAL